MTLAPSPPAGNPKERWYTNSAITGLLGSLLGSLIGVLGTLVVTQLNSANETERLKYQVGQQLTQLEKQWVLSENNEQRREARAAIAEVAESFGLIQQSMDWITWFGLNEPEKVNEKFYNDYNKEMKENWPKVLKATAKVAAYSESAYEILNDKAADKLSDIDVIISKAMVNSKGDERLKAFREIKKNLEDCQDFWRKEIKRSMDQIRRQGG